MYKNGGCKKKILKKSTSLNIQRRLNVYIHFEFMFKWIEMVLVVCSVMLEAMSRKSEDGAAI